MEDHAIQAELGADELTRGGLDLVSEIFATARKEGEKVLLASPSALPMPPSVLWFGRFSFGASAVRCMTVLTDRRLLFFMLGGGGNPVGTVSEAWLSALERAEGAPRGLLKRRFQIRLTYRDGRKEVVGDLPLEQGARLLELVNERMPDALVSEYMSRRALCASCGTGLGQDDDRCPNCNQSFLDYRWAKRRELFSRGGGMRALGIPLRNEGVSMASVFAVTFVVFIMVAIAVPSMRGHEQFHVLFILSSIAGLVVLTFVGFLFGAYASRVMIRQVAREKVKTDKFA